jgi:sigma-B regulation protein RsbU (phosphoserine phosphatase)
MIVQENLLLVIAGTAITTIGGLSLLAHFTTTLSRMRILLWFGMFATPYGLALICRGILFAPSDSETEWLIVVFGKLVGLLSSIPALLLFREFYGRGWWLSSKWFILLYGIGVGAVLLLMAIHDRPRSIPSPGIALVILVPLVLVMNHFAGYRSPPVKNRSLIFAGLLLFFATFSFDHLAHWSIGDERAMTEPLGFVGLTLCLGYVTSKRVAANEREWLSMAGEMRAARRIQAAILPASMPEVEGFSIAARYSPMTAVAGDSYGFPRVQPGFLGVFLGDVMGHGVPAALIASMAKVSVFASAERTDDPGKILGGLNTTICNEAPSQLVTGVYASLNRKAGTGAYCAAGHPPPLLWRRGAQRLDTLDAAGLLLGIRSSENYCATSFAFEKGDRLLIYSDGLTEAENRSTLSFGVARLPTLMESKEDLTAEQFAVLLLQEVVAWSMNGSVAGQSDDITFVVIDIL